MISDYPQAAKLASYEEASQQWELVQNIITSIRSSRQQAAIAPKVELEAVVKLSDKNHQALLEMVNPLVSKLANIKELRFDEKAPAASLIGVGKGYEVFIPVGGLIDLEKEIKRLESEKKRLEKILMGIDKNFPTPIS